MSREQNRAANKARREKSEEYWFSEVGDRQAESELPPDWLPYIEAAKLVGRSLHSLDYRRDIGDFQVYRIPTCLLPARKAYHYPSELQRKRITDANRRYTRGAWAVSRAEVLAMPTKRTAND